MAKREELPTVIDKICETIALYEPFTMDEIKEGYFLLNSLDDLLEKIATAKEYHESLLKTIEYARDPKGSVREILNRKPFRPGPETATIGIGIGVDLRLKR